jgi:hypothetical protein
MATLVTDKNRLNALACGRLSVPVADRLFRDGSIFFVGGELPVYETLVTMFDSFCMEATSLFFLTFGPRGAYAQGEEMARQIKKNFHARLMAALDPEVDTATLERVYAAGVDNVVIHLDGRTLHQDSADLPAALYSARSVFPRWGAAAFLRFGEESPGQSKNRIDRLLGEGIVPLLRFPGRSAEFSPKDVETVLQHLVAGWERSSIPLQAYLPLISSMTPLVQDKPAGIFRGIVDRLRDRRQLAESDIRRHLRVQRAEDSMDSAAL